MSGTWQFSRAGATWNRDPVMTNAAIFGKSTGMKPVPVPNTSPRGRALEARPGGVPGATGVGLHQFGSKIDPRMRAGFGVPPLAGPADDITGRSGNIYIVDARHYTGVPKLPEKNAQSHGAAIVHSMWQEENVSALKERSDALSRKVKEYDDFRPHHTPRLPGGRVGSKARKHLSVAKSRDALIEEATNLHARVSRVLSRAREIPVAYDGSDPHGVKTKHDFLSFLESILIAIKATELLSVGDRVEGPSLFRHVYQKARKGKRRFDHVPVISPN
eukprot:g3856.t1